MTSGGAKTILVDFTQWTTSHGIPHIGRSRHVCLIVFWVLITLVATGLLVWQVVMLAIRYRRYDVTVGLELRFEKRPFPAVTVCDLNPYKFSAVKNSPDVMDLLNAYQYALEKATCGGNCGEFDAAKDAKLKEFGLDKLTDTVALQAQVRDYLVMLMASKPGPSKRTMSNHRDFFLKSCSFNTEDCSTQLDGFKEFLDPKLGTCFTFNYKEGEQTEYKTNRAGPLYGLRMILLTNTSDYLPISEMAGMKIVLHNQSEAVFPDTYGYNIEVGTSTAMGISFKEIIRLPHPYGQCVEVEKQLEVQADYLYEKQYTSEGCQRSCFQKQIIENCSCSDPNYPDVEGYERCTPNNGDHRVCWSNFVNEGMDSKSCNCQLPCEEGVYDVTVSASTWPSPTTSQIADCKLTPEECRTQYRENGAMVEIYYEQLNYQLLEETPAYEFVNLASDFGGQIGLWLGLSVISMIEFFVVMFQVCIFYCTSGRKLD